LFFDYNGNGVQDGEEPAVAGALVQLKGNAGNVIDEAMTDSSGDYKLEDVRTGSYSLHLGVEHFSDRKFRYMCRSPNEFRAASDDYPVSLEGIVQVNIGLMEGFLTLPLRSNTRYQIGRFYDWDPSESTYLWWNGKKGPTGGGIHGIDPNHIGIDYDIPEGEDVLACAPGVVSHFETGPKGQLGLTIKHAAGDLAIYYSHLSRYVVEANQKVARGQKVAESGMTGAVYPHLHINNYRMVGNLQQFYDFYAPTFPPSGRLNGYWERKLPDRTDYWKVINEGEHPGGSGFWTVRNDAKFSV
jgi:murein DD-endopeptidase MepM/ murein hydrolase activator NlpD